MLVCAGKRWSAGEREIGRGRGECSERQSEGKSERESGRERGKGPE